MKQKKVTIKQIGIILSLLFIFTILGNSSVSAEFVGEGLFQEISFNCKHPDLVDPRVRKALSHIVDRETVLNDYIDSYPYPEYYDYAIGVTSYSPLFPWYNWQIKPDEYNLLTAKTLLKAAGYDLDNGDELSFTLIVPNTNPWRVAWAEFVTEAFNNVGINAELEILGWFDEEDPYGGLIPRVFHWSLSDNDDTTITPTFDEGGYDMVFIGMGTGYDTDFDIIIDGTYMQMYTINSPDNIYQYTNPTVNTLAANYIKSGGNRGLATAIQLQLHLDPPSIILFHAYRYY